MSTTSRQRNPKRPNSEPLVTSPGHNFGFIPFKPFGLREPIVTKAKGAFGRQDGKPALAGPNKGK